ncbi:hypothetical protein C6503_11390 [Candidatus Poribacteria bacterium]|nr:MAG: hypothetical protein C6503_11390 [Candidatus Poribacteria bacterium]
MSIIELYTVIRGIFEASMSVADFVDKIMDRTQNDPDLLDVAKQDEGKIVSKALHRLQRGDGTAPRIVLVGETSTGKSALVNALFGSLLAKVKLTTDTTDSVLCVQFPSDLVIYDTPGIFGEEKLENITRLFLDLEQDFDKATHVTEVPFQPSHESKEIIQLSGSDIRKQAPIDIVLWTINISRPLTRPMRKELSLFFSELEKKFGEHLVVAGTHLDVLNKVSAEEKQEQLRVWSKISNGQIIAVSSETGEGLSHLVVELFKRLPGDVSLSRLQQSLSQVRKIDRCSFVVTEISHPLAMIMLMSGNNPQEIEIYVIILITILCNHYSVDEETWIDLHGDGLEIARTVRENTGIKRTTVERAPIGLWEHIKSWFGVTFYGTREKYRTLGVQGLSELLPIFYELIHEFEEFETPALDYKSISKRVLSRQSDLNPLVRSKNMEKLSLQINDLLKSLLKL